MTLGLAGLLKTVVAEEFQTAIDEIIKDESITTNAEMLLRLCQLITSQIDIVLQKHYFYYSKSYGYLYNKGNNIAEADEQKLMVFAAQLIYMLRTFIHNEEITFHMASRTERGGYEASAFVPQTEVLKSLSSLANKAVGVSTAVQKDLINQHQYDTAFQIQRQNLWTQVESLATPFVDFNTSHKVDLGGSDGDPHWAYQSLKQDIMVYIAFYGKKGTNYTKYYDLDGAGDASSLMAFNNGWLWEWYNKVLHGGSDEEYLGVNDSIMSGSLRPIILGPDYTPGTKEGDFRDLQNRQIQSKYGNTKIISYNNIRHIIYDLESALIQYIAEGKAAGQHLVGILQEHFFPESASIGEKFAEDTVNDLLRKFDSKKA